MRISNGLNNGTWLLIGKVSMILNYNMKSKYFPQSVHIPVNKRMSGQIWIDFKR